MSRQIPSVLITGCSSGIGHATARRLAERGLTVYATARRPETLSELADLGCRTLALDVTDPGSISAAVARVEEETGVVGALVNNAGYSQSGPLEEIPVDQVRRQFETNVFGLLELTRTVLPGMRRAGAGRIVNLGSMGGVFTFPGGGAYHATKHALEALSDALRFEVKGFGVRVVLVQPGLIRTGFSETAVDSLEGLETDRGPYAGFRATVARLTEEAYVKPPLSWLAGDPDDVAKVIEKALTARSPRARYRVTASARLLMSLRWILPDAAWDAVVATNYPRPGVDGATAEGATRGVAG